VRIKIHKGGVEADFGRKRMEKQIKETQERSDKIRMEVSLFAVWENKC
jgi:hypothetical protein